MAIEWKPRYSIGIEEVDKQHQELFKRANELMEACQENKGEEKIGELIDFLADYVQTHFETEEKVQQQYDYPGYERHKEIHADFVEQVNEFKEKFEAGNTTPSFLMKMNKTITRWLVNHVRKEDQKIAEHIEKVEE